MTDTEILDWLQENKDRIEIRMNDRDDETGEFLISYPVAQSLDGYQLRQSYLTDDIRDLVEDAARNIRPEPFPVFDPFHCPLEE